MKIVVLIDPEAFVPEDPQFEKGVEHALTEVEYHVVETLHLMGHRVEVLPLREDLLSAIAALREARPDLVFNLTEHYRGDRRFDAHIAALLELTGIPFTGSGPTGLLLSRDKSLCKRLLSHSRLKVPGFSVVPPGRKRTGRRLRYPVIVKPNLEDGSDGITLGSVVHSDAEMRERVRFVHERMRQPAICEEYIEGREYYVGVLGNTRLQVLPARELNFGQSEGRPLIATARVKRDEAYREKWGITYGDADIPAALQKRLAMYVKKVFRLLEFRDYARIDLRVTAGGDIYFLEGNANPDLTHGDEFAESAARAGIGYEALIARIVRHARRRTKGNATPAL